MLPESEEPIELQTTVIREYKVEKMMGSNVCILSIIIVKHLISV